MQTKYHFISGLPRSGSTLLSAILRQNPRFRAGMSSTLLPLFTGAMSTMAGEGHALISDERRTNVLRGLFTSWAADLPEGTVVFDTNRLWTARLPALLTIFPNARLVCTVRRIPAILDSIERILRVNPLLPSRLFNDEERTNVYSRADALFQRNRLIGGPWTSLKDAFYGPNASSLLIVEYDYLARAPATVLPLIYRFLGEAPFEHDFENIVYDEPEFDAELRLPGLHKVRPKVSLEPRASVLPPDLIERFRAHNFWTNPGPSRAHLITPRPDPAKAAESA